MVMFTGLWRSNNRYDSQDNPHKGQMAREGNSHTRGEAADPESTQNGLNDVQEHEELPDKTRRKRRLRSVSSYSSSVLFGGLWARSEARRDKLSSDDERGGLLTSTSSPEEPYGTLEGNHATHLETSESAAVNDQDTDEEDDFPSLTSVFNPDEIDWRVLRMCFIYLAVYATVAILAYCFIFERWTVIDALYFAVSTFTTVGYGDLQPSSTMGQLFTICFAVYGLIVLGIFIGIFGHAISEGQANAIRKFNIGRQRKLVKLLFRSSKKVDAARQLQHNALFQDHVSLMEDIFRVLRAEFPSILVVIILAFILGVREGWSITSTAYFAIMSASTTGYGDYTPSTQIDKLYCVFFLPISVAVFGEVLGRIASVYITRRTRQAEQSFLRRNITRFDMRRMDANDDGMVSMEEWLSFMLVSLQKVDADFLDDLKSIFRELDTNGNGFLDKDDLIELHKSPQWKQLREFGKRS